MRQLDWNAAARIVGRLARGERVVFDRRDMEPPGGDIGSFIIDMSGFSVPDRIIGKIIGSGYTHRHYQDSMTGVTVFERLHDELPDGVRSYVDPDRRYGYKLRSDGLWQPEYLRLSARDERVIRCALRGHRWAPCKVMPPPSATVLSFGDVAQEMTIELVDGERCIECDKQRRD